MTLPVTIPNTFANATASIPLANLDANFVTIYGAVNGIGNGAEALSNVTITGGTIENAAVGGSTAAAGSFTTLNTSGAVVFNDAGADVDFRVEGDTEANLLFVDASADAVGIGTNAPINELTFGPTTSIISPDTTDGSDSKRLRFCGGGAAAGSRGSYVTVYGNEYSGAEGELTLVAGDAVGGNIVFYTGSAVERMRITSAGAVEIANGNLVFSTNGTGIDFSASAGGGATSSLLDDYEEGTWTPSLKFDGADILMTYGTQAGHYTKIGNLVHIQLRITLTNKGTSTGNATIAGLPFTPQLNNGGLAYGYIDGAPNSAIWNTATQIPTLDFTSTLIQLRYVNNGNGTQHTQASFDNTTDLIMWGNYVV